MKKVIDLGNNVKVESTDDGFKIISANGNLVKLDCEGEFLSYENVLAKAKAEEKKAFLKDFTKIDVAERAEIIDWISSSEDACEDERTQEFFFQLGKAMAEVEYDFYCIHIVDIHQKVNLYAKYGTLLSGYTLEKATINEATIGMAYFLMKEETSLDENLESEKYFLFEKLYVLKKE